MRSRPILFLSIVFSILITQPASAASFFPTAAIGDVFTGSMTINPATPCTTCGVFNPFVYKTFFNAGSLSVSIGGVTFSGTSLYEEVYFDNTPSGPLGR
jgi:hypothetical protein